MQDIFLYRTKKRNKVNLRARKVTIIILFLALLTRVLVYFAGKNPTMVERLYSTKIYPYIGTVLGFISSLVAFSIAEFLLITLVLFLIFGVFFILLRPRIFLNNIKRLAQYLIRSLAIIYILFYFLWGFNYYREDYSAIANMGHEDATYEELKELALANIFKANALRATLNEDENGVFFMDETIGELNRIANLGFSNYQVGDIDLGGKYGKAKPVFLSKYMSYTGIVGIYIPFTSEPNVNMNVPKQSILSSISHEIAHQRGFAKEDEANFIAYKANVNNPDERFQYSGYYLAINHLMNEVYRQNRDDYSILYNEINDGVKRDMQYSRDYWNAREGKLRERANKVNDTYLKANNQSDGVKSYSGVVKLLLAEYKDRNTNY